MPWRPLGDLVGKIIGKPAHTPSRSESFRDEALPHLPSVSRFALSLTRDEANADDLVQETFLRAFRSWDQFRPGSDCRAWLFAICRNTYLRASQREQRVTAHDDADLESLAVAALHASAQQDGLDNAFESADVVAAVRRAVDELPVFYREVVALVDLEEQSYEETARILDIPKGTVRSRLFRARRLLQEKLIEHARDAGLTDATRDRHEDHGR